MKTKIWILAVCLFGIVLCANSTDRPKMNVVPVEEQKAMIAYESPTASTVEITIANKAGDILYYRKTDGPVTDYRKVFNFKELGTGYYDVSLNYGGQSINKEVKVTSNKVVVGKTERLFEPYFVTENKSLDISFLNITQKPVYLNIYKDGEQVTRIKLGKKMDIQKRINLSKLEKGEYQVTLSAWFKEHKATISI